MLVLVGAILVGVCVVVVDGIVLVVGNYVDIDRCIGEKVFSTVKFRGNSEYRSDSRALI